jgi:hypothetical protein
MQYLLLFRNNNGCTNAPQCYVMRTLPFLFKYELDYFMQEQMWFLHRPADTRVILMKLPVNGKKQPAVTCCMTSYIIDVTGIWSYLQFRHAEVSYWWISRSEERMGTGALGMKVEEYSYIRMERVIYRGGLTSVVYCWYLVGPCLN